MHAGILYPKRACGAPQARPVASAGALPLTPPTRRPSRNAWSAQPRRSWAPVVAAAAGADAGSNGGLSANPAQKRAEIAANVDRAAQMIGEIVDEVTREMFVSEAVAYLVRDQADQTELAAVRTAVARRVEFLDANFLAALTGFIRACDARGDRQLASLLMHVREEVLRQVASRMPSAAQVRRAFRCGRGGAARRRAAGGWASGRQRARGFALAPATYSTKGQLPPATFTPAVASLSSLIQVLDLALRHADKDARLDLLRTALSGGSGGAAGPQLLAGEAVPAADLDMLSATASKFIDEMEEQAEVRVRVCTVLRVDFSN